MKKAAVSSVVALSTLSASMLFPGALWGGAAFAQAPAGQVQMDPAEFTDYDNAVNKQTTPQTQAPALEAYLAKYPKSVVKADVLQRLMIDYSSFDHAKALDTADKVLQLNPNNLQADVIEVAYRAEAAQAVTDPAAKQTAMDAAANYARAGLATTKPEGVSDADFNTQKNAPYATPTFYSTIGNDDLLKKDYAGAVEAYKAELAAVKPEATTVPGTALQDTFFLGYAYSLLTPPDYVSCTFYATRAASFAPDQFKAQFQPTATYCYRKYHGGTDGYDAVVTAAKSSVNPPSGFSIVPAPSPADQAAKFVQDNAADLASLAISDKEFVLQYGKPADADKVFDTIKGKTTEIPDAVVVKATPDQLQVSVSEDAIHDKVADFSYNMKEPLKTLPDVGSKVTLTGTYTSYTQNPVLIVMSDGAIVPKKAPVTKKPPVRRSH